MKLVKVQPKSEQRGSKDVFEVIITLQGLVPKMKADKGSRKSWNQITVLQKLVMNRLRLLKLFYDECIDEEPGQNKETSDLRGRT